MRIPRWPALVLLFAAVIGLVLLDRRDPEPVRSELAVEALPPMPLAAGPEAIASTWYCAGGTSVEGGFADHTVTVVNPSEDVVRGTVEVVATEVLADESLVHLETLETTVEVPPLGSESVRLGDVSVGAFTAALLELDSGSVIVTHSVEGPTGFDRAPCASSASENWYLPAGSTSRDAREILAVFNPFPDDAVINVTFATDDGVRAPQKFDGVPVPAGTLVPLDVTEIVARWDQLSVAVETRVGRVVVDRLVTFDGTEGLTGLTLASGAPRPAPAWVFPSGEAATGVAQSYAIYNPDPDQAAEVDFEVRLDSPESNGSVEPFELTIPPRRRVVVAVNRDDIHPVSTNVTVDTSGRVPPAIGHTVTVRSFNGVPVVVEQLTTAIEPPPSESAPAVTEEPAPEAQPDDGTPADSTAPDETAPDASTPVPDDAVAAEETEPATVPTVAPVGSGVAVALGAPATGTSLVLDLPSGDRSAVAVVNPSFTTIARVTLTAVVNGQRRLVPGFDDIEIGSQRRIAIADIAELLDAEPTMLLIESSSGVVVQRISGRIEVASLSAAIAVPVGGEVESPELFG